MTPADLHTAMAALTIEAGRTMSEKGNALLSVVLDELRRRLRVEAARERASSGEDAR